jgi:hypothetical protein
MLVATRDPVQRHGQPQTAPLPHASHPSRVGRWVSILQLAGSLLAIPVGLASGYSIYRANFSPETTCANLRGSIVAMIDKQIDASTRRMLVRKDVEEFEKTCLNVDPDAGAAFKSLLAAEPAATASIPAKAAPEVVKPLALPAHEWKKPEPVQTAKPQVKEPKEVKEAREPAHATSGDPATDARWLDAVRHALTTHQAEHAAAESGVKPLAPPPAPHNAAVVAAPNTERAAAAPSVPAAGPVAAAPITVAPALPPPATLNTASEPAPVHADGEHPVPPGSIPVTPVNGDALTTGSVSAQAQSSSWTDHIPFFGK